MRPDRRSVLRGIGGVFMGGTVLSALSSSVAAATNTRRSGSSSNEIALAASFDEDQQFRGLSTVVRVESVADPADDEGGADDVLSITSLPAEDEDSDDAASAVVFDYGVSVVDLQDRGLTVDDLAAYEGEDDESDGGFAYDWWSTDEDVVGVDTDHEQSGVGPDEAWLVLEDPDAETAGDGRDSGLGRLVSGQLTPVFRTMYADEGTGEWHTRTVSDELEENESPSWRELSVDDRAFVDLDDGLVDTYGDARVVGVGVGRGDPFWGPSVLDTYYRNLRVAGEAYAFPVADGGPGRGDRGQGT